MVAVRSSHQMHQAGPLNQQDMLALRGAHDTRDQLAAHGKHAQPDLPVPLSGRLSVERNSSLGKPPDGGDISFFSSGRVPL